MSERLKLRFRFENAQGSEETETLWVIRREDGYEIDTIPFDAQEVRSRGWGRGPTRCQTSEAEP